MLGDALAVFALGSLFLATLLRLVPSLAVHVARFDTLGLVPEWRFFAPKPGRGDHALLYRDSLDAREWGPWTELSLVVPRRWHHFLWNPERREKKALLDFVAALMAIIRETGTEGVEITSPYLALLVYVTTAVERIAVPALTQFLLLNHDGSAGPDEFVPMFLSQVHHHERLS
jgi:hypothetical protein